MADVKISALPAATVPLAGTEVLPIVQSSTTKQVSVANLTAGRAISASSITNSALTSGRVTYAGASGLLSDSANLTYDGTNLILGTGNRLLVSRSSSDANNWGVQVTGSSAYTNGIQLTYSGVGASAIWVPAASSLAFGADGASGTTEKMRLTSTSLYTASGVNVGIGNSNPSTALDVNGAITALGGNAPTGGFNLRNVAGTVTPRLVNDGADGTIIKPGASGAYVAINNYANSANLVTFADSGIVTMSAYGAGAATFSAAGVISSVSDETWKTKDGVPTNTDAMLQKLEPGYWFYNEEKAPTFGEERQLGFYAQNVHEAIGEEAAPTPQEGKPWGYHDRSVLAIAVMSLKNALNTIEELKQRIKILENK